MHSLLQKRLRNKKVLLRERKRHTARRVVSTPSVLARGGYPPPPPAASWHSGKCCKALWDMGTPPVDRQIDGWTDACQNITFPRTTYAGGNYDIVIIT